MSDKEKNTEGFIPTHGGYRNLFSYQKAEIIYYGTVYFTNRFFHKYETFKKAIEHEDPEICANVMITLIKICTYLLNQQIKQLEIAFVKEGVLRERMTKARIEERNKKK